MPQRTLPPEPPAAADVVIPFPAPAGGACWPPRRCSVPLAALADEDKRHRHLRELAHAAEAMSAGDVHLVESLTQRAFEAGRHASEREHYVRGWYRGAFAGAAAVLGLAAAVVVLASLAGAITVWTEPPALVQRPTLETV